MPDRPTHTEAQWEMTEGELHDLRAAMAGVGEGVKCLQDGTWDIKAFISFWIARKAEHDAATLERFKNITKRYGRQWRCTWCGTTNIDTGQHPAWCVRCYAGEISEP